MKARILQPMGCDVCDEFPTGIKPAGTVIDHPDAWELVRIGAATAADDTAQQRAGLTPEEWTEAREAYVRMSRGIHPEDFEAYENGEMAGYNADGSLIPGPNAIDAEEDDE